MEQSLIDISQIVSHITYAQYVKQGKKISGSLLESENDYELRKELKADIKKALDRFIQENLVELAVNESDNIITYASILLRRKIQKEKPGFVN